MENLKRLAAKGAVAALLATGAWAASSAAAQAYIVCNDDGDCWHAHTRYTYPGNLGITFHDDDWTGYHRHHYHWWGAPADDDGYYRGGVWIYF